MSTREADDRSVRVWRRNKHLLSQQGLSYVSALTEVDGGARVEAERPGEWLAEGGEVILVVVGAYQGAVEQERLPPLHAS